MHRYRSITLVPVRGSSNLVGSRKTYLLPRAPFPTCSGLMVPALHDQPCGATTNSGTCGCHGSSTRLEKRLLAKNPKMICIWFHNAWRDTAIYPRGRLQEGLEKVRQRYTLPRESSRHGSRNGSRKVSTRQTRNPRTARM